MVALLVAASAASAAAAAERQHYRPDGRCDGLPRVALATPPGFCVGLVADRMILPRGIVVARNGDLLVADLGSWVTPNKGVIWRLQRKAAGYRRSALLRGLDRPHGLAWGPDGKLYVGEASRVFRFDPDRLDAPAEDVIGGGSTVPALPADGRHPLTALAFDADGRLLVAVGSASDNCENADGTVPDAIAPCAESDGGGERATVRRLMHGVDGWRLDVIAHGLRNAMAMAVHPRTGELWAADNARDAIAHRDAALDDERLPHDELNRVVVGAHYGWPYCYDIDVAAPEYAGRDCARYHAPVRLLPPHAAPLGMAFHDGTRMPPGLRGALIVGYHGYRVQGHRLVAWPFDAKVNPGDNPAGEAIELIGGWEAGDNGPMGAPTGVAVAPDGAIYVTEDRNGAVLRLTYRRPQR